MKSEFRAVGVDRGRRGAETDRLLDFLNRCFRAKDDIVEENGQAFLFRPNPGPPPIFIGGASPQTLQRVVRYAQGWMPMGADPAKLAPAIEKLHALAREAGRPRPEVAALGGLPDNDPSAAADRLHALAEIGVTRFISGGRYSEASEFRAQVEALCDIRSRLG
jgi:hypothetical protein